MGLRKWSMNEVSQASPIQSTCGQITVRSRPKPATIPTLFESKYTRDNSLFIKRPKRSTRHSPTGCWDDDGHRKIGENRHKPYYPAGVASHKSSVRRFDLLFPGQRRPQVPIRHARKDHTCCCRMIEGLSSHHVQTPVCTPLFFSLSSDPSHMASTILTCSIRLFERGAACVGLDFLAHPFWDKYIEFEERMEASDRIFAILGRIIHIPMHQYARYFEKYRQWAQTRPLTAIAPAGTLTQLQMDIENEGAGYKAGRNQAEVERELRARIDNYHLEIFRQTQSETTKRWTYESEIKRPYFHVTELDESQLANWRKYLDFEEGEGDYTRIQFLHERCLVTCAQHDEFWLRYARWMLAQPGKEEEVRNIYQRASCFFVPIALPQTRLQYAYFEEMTGRVDVAKDIHEAILVNLPGHVGTIVSLANCNRRHSGLEAAVAVYQAQIDLQIDPSSKAALVAEWAKL